DQPVARKVRRAVQAARGVFVIDVAGVLRCCAEQLVNPRFALATRILTATEELLAASDFIAQEVIAADAGPPRDVGGDGAIGVVAYVEHTVPLDPHGLDARRGVL